MRFLQPVKFFNGLEDVKAGQVVRAAEILGSDAARVVAGNGDTWTEIGIDGKRAEWVREDIAVPAHTPEPWQHSADLPHHGCRLIHAADGYLVADAGRITKRTGADMDSNARRIVACVNACAGMTDPAVEIAALRAALVSLLAEHDEHARSTPDTIRRHHDAIAAARKALAGKGAK